MGRLERFVVLWAVLYMALYVLTLFLTSAYEPDIFWRWFAPFHFLCMAQNLIAIVISIHDLYKRPFPHENQKVTWTLLIMWTGGIGWLIYVFKYALKPRPVRANVASLISGEGSADGSPQR